MPEIIYSINNSALNNITSAERIAAWFRHKSLGNCLAAKQKTFFKQEHLPQLFKSLGLSINAKQVLKLYRGKEANISINKSQQIITNYRNVVEYIDNLRFNHTKILNLENIKHLNKLLSVGYVDIWEQGNWRAGVVTEPKYELDRWGKKLQANLINNSQILEDVGTYLNDILLEYKIELNPIIKAGLVYGLLLALYPFPALNQLTAISSLEMIFNLSRYRNKLYSLPVIIEEHEDRFIEACSDLRSQFKQSSKAIDLGPFIELFSELVLMAIKDVKKQVQEELKCKQADQDKRLKGLNERQKEIIEYLKFHQQIRTKDYKDLFGMCHMSAYRDFQVLLKKNLIEKKGDKRTTYYILKEEDNQKKDKAVKLSTMVGRMTEEYRSMDELDNSF